MTKRISQSTESKIILNNRKISKLLEENEELYLSELSDEDRRIYCVEYERIGFPPNYVRKKDYFISKYGLDNVTSNYVNKNNIAYLMQYCDLTQYISTRFFMYGQIKKANYFFSILNTISILEVVIREITDEYRSRCSSCKKQPRCPYIINQKANKDLKLLVKRLNDLNIIKIGNMDIIIDAIDIRNNIHIRLMDKTIYQNKKLDRKFYNLLMKEVQLIIKNCNLINIQSKECSYT